MKKIVSKFPKAIAWVLVAALFFSGCVSLSMAFYFLFFTNKAVIVFLLLVAGIMAAVISDLLYDVFLRNYSGSKSDTTFLLR